MTAGRAAGYDPRNGVKEGALGKGGERLVLMILLLAGLAVRVWRLDQPIVENFVGRQIPTAMVARNLDRGSGFLWPELDTGPIPSLFLVEPPVDALFVVAWKRQTGMPLDPSGRLVSALATVLAAWGLFGLARRREGPGVALGAVAAFLAFPVTIRYGRAFQPDAVMLGLLVAALRCWDGFEATGDRRWLAAGWPLLAAGLATKITSAYVLVPLVGAILCERRRTGTVALALLAIVPALLWYGHVAHLMREGMGTSASEETAAAWLRAIWPTALLRPQTYANVGRFLFVRAFTPLGLVLGLVGLVWPARLEGDRLWRVWAGSAAAMLVALAGKLHHEYYFLALAPVLAVGLARVLAGLARSGRSGRAAAVGLGAAGLMMAGWLSASTWHTPAEWAGLPEAAQAVRGLVGPRRLIAAPEALIYMADRRGYRLEYTPEAATRATREWLGRPAGRLEPVDLVEFYRLRGAAVFADVQPEPIDPDRRALHAAIRRTYAGSILLDRPGVALVARLDRPGAGPVRSRNP